MRRLLLLFLVALAACGGSSDAPPPDPPPNPLYVSPAGRDTNPGDLESPLRSIRKAAQIALDGYEIVVAPGVYAEEVTTDRTGTPAQAISLIADLTGSRTESEPGEVVIDVTGVANAAGISLSNTSDVLIDGFTVTGSSDGGIVLKSGSNRATIRNCIVSDNPGDGIRLQDSGAATLFNNLVFRNGKTGIVIAGQRSGSPDARVINNTVAANGLRGITIGTTSAASPRAFLRNDILFENGDSGDLQLRVITDPRSDVGFDGDYNLLSPSTYEPSSLRGEHDLVGTPQFVNAGGGNYHLAPSSPAIDAGDSDLGVVQVSALRARTTTGDGLDDDEIDLGFHFTE
jgi:parallel beta-helix repeat protein